MNDSLKSIVAELLAVSPDLVGPDRVLSGARLQGSLGRSILDAAMRRRLGVQTQACYTAKTYGELEAAVNGSAVVAVATDTKVVTTETLALTAPAIQVAPPTPAAFTAAPARFSQSTQTTACGVDIELIESLPTTTDFWSHEFYTTNFTPGEIAYCLTQQSPSHHFAARWCAKEALKKCEPALMPEQMKNIEVVSRENAAPSLRHLANGSPTNLPYALSLSHTSHAAVAVVVRVAAPPPPPPAPTVTAMPPMPEPPPPPSKALGLLSFAFSFVAAVVAIVALWIAIHRH